MIKPGQSLDQEDNVEGNVLLKRLFRAFKYRRLVLKNTSSISQKIFFCNQIHSEITFSLRGYFNLGRK